MSCGSLIISSTCHAWLVWLCIYCRTELLPALVWLREWNSNDAAYLVPTAMLLTRDRDCLSCQIGKDRGLYGKGRRVAFGTRVGRWAVDVTQEAVVEAGRRYCCWRAAPSNCEKCDPFCLKSLVLRSHMKSRVALVRVTGWSSRVRYGGRILSTCARGQDRVKRE